MIECGDGEGGDRLHQHPPVAHDQHQRGDEEQVVDAEEDVLDAVAEVGDGDLERSLRGGDLDPWPRGAHHGRGLAVAARDPHQHVGDRGLQADEVDPPPGKAARGLDDPALEDRAGEVLGAGAADRAHVVREGQHDRQRHARKERGAPDDGVAVGSDLVDLQIGGAHLVRLRGRGGQERGDGAEDERDGAGHCSRSSAGACGAERVTSSAGSSGGMTIV